MDKIAEKIAALGVPSLVLIAAINATGLTGAAAITTALAAIGPFGIVGGIATLGVAGIISESIVNYGSMKVYKAVINELYSKRGETKESIMMKIEKYPISKELKRELAETLIMLEQENDSGVDE